MRRTNKNRIARRYYIVDQTMYDAEEYNGEVHRNNYAYVCERFDEHNVVAEFDTVKEALVFISEQ